MSSKNLQVGAIYCTGLSIIDPNPSLALVRPRGGSRGGWESLGLEELRESLWELWEGAAGMKFGRFEAQNLESSV